MLWRQPRALARCITLIVFKLHLLAGSLEAMPLSAGAALGGFDTQSGFLTLNSGDPDKAPRNY